MTLGKKISELRQRLHMTQSELAGTEITRNMLSSIENGAALPSLSTLLYLAERLETPVGYFLDEKGDWLTYKKMELLPTLKRLFENGRYKELLKSWETRLGETDDELALLLAEASAAYGLHLLFGGSLSTLYKIVARAKSFCDATVYPTDHIRAKIELLRAIADNVQAPRFELDSALYERLAESAIATDLYFYVTENDADYTYSDPILNEHMAAKRLIKDGKYADAAVLLDNLESKKTQANIGAFVLFRIYADLEHCHKELRNFELAYRYSGKRLSLLSAFRT